jgi:hypothetical protein
MRTRLLIGMIALLGACTERAPLPAAPSTAKPGAAVENTSAASKLSAAGIGAIRFGMTLDQAQQAVGARASLPQPFDPACSMVRFASLPKLRFMVENGIVTRADAGPGVDNALGVAIGDPLATVRATHPEAQVTRHKYDENGHYLTFPSADGRAAIILEESGGKVTKMRAGLQPAVAYVETCL